MKKYLLFFVSVLFLLTSCGHSSDEPTVDNKADRTVLAYFLTDQLSLLQGNVETMFEGLQKTDKISTVMIYWDNAGGQLLSPRIFKMTSDGHGSVNGISEAKYLEDTKNLSDYEKFKLVISYCDVQKVYPTSQVSTNKDVITTVLNDMIKASPSTSYGLVFGSHAESWIPSNNVKLSTSRALASTYDDPIDIPDLKESLVNVGKVFDFIIMDACMMGNIEVAYELQGTSDYYIASPMEVPGVGFPYSTIIPYLFSDNYKDYTTKVCDAYASYHKSEENWGNCVAIDCNEITKFTSELKKYIDSYDGSVNLSSVQPYFNSSINGGRYKGLTYDILDFVNKISNNSASSSFMSQLEKTVIAKSFVMYTREDYPSFVNVDTSSLCGMGMYIPISGKSRWNSYITELSWGDASGWSSYISKNNF